MRRYALAPGDRGIALAYVLGLTCLYGGVAGAIVEGLLGQPPYALVGLAPGLVTLLGCSVLLAWRQPPFGLLYYLDNPFELTPSALVFYRLLAGLEYRWAWRIAVGRGGNEWPATDGRRSPPAKRR